MAAYGARYSLAVEPKGNTLGSGTPIRRFLVIDNAATVPEVVDWVLDNEAEARDRVQEANVGEVLREVSETVAS